MPLAAQGSLYFGPAWLFRPFSAKSFRDSSRTVAPAARPSAMRCIRSAVSPSWWVHRCARQVLQYGSCGSSLPCHYGRLSCRCLLVKVRREPCFRRGVDWRVCGSGSMRSGPFPRSRRWSAGSVWTPGFAHASGWPFRRPCRLGLPPRSPTPGRVSTWLGRAPGELRSVSLFVEIRRVLLAWHARPSALRARTRSR